MGSSPSRKAKHRKGENVTQKVSKAIRRSRTDRIEIRRESADKRNADWCSLSPEKQLTELDVRLGKGVGAAKQRARLQQKIESSSNKKQKLKQDNSETVEKAVDNKPKRETKKKA